MGNWRKLHEGTNVSVGMWVEDSMIYFTVEPPEGNWQDHLEQDVEFGITTNDLRRILKHAEVYETQIADD